jgi:hypothetical protein
MRYLLERDEKTQKELRVLIEWYEKAAALWAAALCITPTLRRVRCHTNTYYSVAYEIWNFYFLLG